VKVLAERVRAAGMPQIAAVLLALLEKVERAQR
jgi:hypothetical protein